MTVNITCTVCDGRLLCDACRTAARALTDAGYRVEHSTRIAALRAAAIGSYGFEACIVPIGSSERAVMDAATLLFSGKRLAIVAEATSEGIADLPRAVAVVAPDAFASGAFSFAWLTDPQAIPPVDRPDETTRAAVATEATPRADASLATRRLKRAADRSREALAHDGLRSPPRLDMVAVLEDELAWAKSSGVGFAVVLVHLAGISAAKNAESVTAADARVRAAGETIARAARTTDVIAGNGDDFLVVLAETDIAGARSAAMRIASALRETSPRALPRPRKTRGFAAWSIGRAAYPSDGVTRDGLLARATASLEALDDVR